MKTLAINKHAKSDYEILSLHEGGLVLTGAEVKSAKLGHIQLKGSFLSIDGGELVVKNMFIARYAPAGPEAPHDETRTRKVLVHASELRQFIGKKQAEGLTLVPIRVYTKRSLVKLEFAVAKGKKQYEKRETIKKRDLDRRLRRGLD